jgi:purine-binding chemotaxis protein CheW
MSNMITQEQRNSILPGNHSAGTGQYLTFVLNTELFAIGILNIKEIIDYGNLTEVPLMPVFVSGIINLRGSVVPVIDLSARFGRPTTQIVKRTCIVIVETTSTGSDEMETHQDIGIIVDAVNEVVEIDVKDIDPPPAFGARIRPDFISGMAKSNKGFIILLNVNRVLSVDEIADLGKSAADHEAHYPMG